MLSSRCRLAPRFRRPRATPSSCACVDLGAHEDPDLVELLPFAVESEERADLEEARRDVEGWRFRPLGEGSARPVHPDALAHVRRGLAGRCPQVSQLVWLALHRIHCGLRASRKHPRALQGPKIPGQKILRGLEPLSCGTIHSRGARPLREIRPSWSNCATQDQLRTGRMPVSNQASMGASECVPRRDVKRFHTRRLRGFACKVHGSGRR